MKKITVFLLAAAFISTLSVSCASKKKRSVSDELTAEQEAMMTPEEKAAYLKKQEELKLFDLSWTKKSSKNVDVSFGTVRLRAKKTLGTFNISVLNENGKTIPVLSTSNEYVTSSCYLKAGKKIIKLNQDSAVKSYSRKTESGMQLAYVVDGIAIVVIDFDCFSSDPKNVDIDSVKITTAVKNIGKKRETFEVKYILDTVLGETDRHHFYFADAQPVKSEYEFKNPSENDWFVSQNSNASMIFNFGVLDSSKASSVALANYSTLETKNWKPDMLTYRAFDTVLSYNNSAVGILWDEEKLSVDDSFSKVFYITLSTLEGKIKENPLKNTAKADSKKDVKPAKTENNQTDDSKVADEKPVINRPVNKPEEVEQIKEVEVETVKPDVPSYKLSNDYIFELLDRIEKLDENSVNQDEIDELNRELDLIIELMRK